MNNHEIIHILKCNSVSLQYCRSSHRQQYHKFALPPPGPYTPLELTPGVPDLKYTRFVSGLTSTMNIDKKHSLKKYLSYRHYIILTLYNAYTRGTFFSICCWKVKPDTIRLLLTIWNPWGKCRWGQFYDTAACGSILGAIALYRYVKKNGKANPNPQNLTNNPKT